MPLTKRHKTSEKMQIGDLPEYAYNLLYFWFWSKRQRFRRLVCKLYSSAGVVGIIVIILDIVLSLFHVASVFRGISHWTSIGVLLLLVLLIGYKRKELLQQRRHEVFLESAPMVVNYLDKLVLDKSTKNKSEELRNCIDPILRMLLATFAWKQSLNANVMLPTEGGTLKIEFLQACEGIDYDKGFAPKLGEGGAGLCFQNQAIIYLPNIERRHAVELKLGNGKITQTVQTEVYVKVPKECFKSILCVPVVARCKCYGVLNLDSRRSDPFDERDYFVVAFFGAIIGLALSRYGEAFTSASTST